MNSIANPDLSKLFPRVEHIITDFDGVWTDNRVLTDASSNEFVVCSKADSLGVNIFTKYCQLHCRLVPITILTKETNYSVASRACKIGVPIIQSADNKLAILNKKFSCKLQSVLYLGNDLNDLAPMLSCGFSAAPADSHPLILKSAQYVFPQNGGSGFVRAVLESLMGFSGLSDRDVLKYLES